MEPCAKKITRKNNPILVGEPGVGKTALVEGLALRIAEGNVPESLKTVTLRTLDLGLLQAGAGVKGEFEQRLKNVIDAVQQSPVPVLLFIDEAHTIIGAGNAAMDVARTAIRKGVRHVRCFSRAKQVAAISPPAPPEGQISWLAAC